MGIRKLRRGIAATALAGAALATGAGQASAFITADFTKGPFYGKYGTFFADVTGDGWADAIAINDGAVTMRRARTRPYESWSYFDTNEELTRPEIRGPFYGTRGTYFADVDGDRDADLIAVNEDGVLVWRIRATAGHYDAKGNFVADTVQLGYGPSWTNGAFYGSRGTYFADVTGDRKADAIAVNDDTITVRRSTGSDFGTSSAANENWTGGAFYGSRGTYFADVTADGFADAIVVNDDTVTVACSTGSGFRNARDWTGGPFYGSRGTYFAPVWGNDGSADAIAVNDDTITVRKSKAGNHFNGSSNCSYYNQPGRLEEGFETNRDWTQKPYYGSRGTYFANVQSTGSDYQKGPDGGVEAIVVNDDTVTVGW